MSAREHDDARKRYLAKDKPMTDETTEARLERIRDDMFQTIVTNSARPSDASWLFDLARTAATLQDRVRELEAELQVLEAEIACHDTEEAGWEADLDQSRAREAKLREALAFATEKDALLNLEGALIDLDRFEADEVCRKTIRRVCKQIADARAILEGDKPHG